MRIARDQADFLKQAVAARVPRGRVYLFGSRTDDGKRGGDIDIMVIAPRRLSFEERSGVRTGFWKKFGEQKIDIVSFGEDEHPPFRNVIEAEAQAL